MLTKYTGKDKNPFIAYNISSGEKPKESKAGDNLYIWLDSVSIKKDKHTKFQLSSLDEQEDLIAKLKSTFIELQKVIVPSLSGLTKEIKVPSPAVDFQEEIAASNDRLKIKLGEEEIDTLNPIFVDLFNEINQSKYILDFEDDWDEDGAKAYKSETWIKAVNILITYFNSAYDKFGEILSVPKIYHGPNGAIDLLWKSKDNYRLLVKVPEGSQELSFYGDDYKGTKFEGKFDISEDINKILLFALLDCK